MPSRAIELIKECAPIIGEFENGSTTSLGTTTTLIDSRFINSNMNASDFAEFGVLIESGTCIGQVAFVTPSGLNRSTGTLTVTPAFTAAIDTAIAFSLYDGTRLPPYRKGKRKGWLEILNDALRRTPIEDTITVTGVSGQVHYTIDTATYPWLTDDTRIIDVQYPVTSADDAPRIVPRSSWEWVADGETYKLRFRGGSPAQTGQSFTIKVNRPANSKLRINSVWTDQSAQSSGFSSGSATWTNDAVIPDIAVLRPLMVALAYEELAAIGAPGQTVAEWLAKAAMWHGRVAQMRARRQAKDRTQNVVRLRPVASYAGGRR